MGRGGGKVVAGGGGGQTKTGKKKELMIKGRKECVAGEREGQGCKNNTQRERATENERTNDFFY